MIGDSEHEEQLIADVVDLVSEFDALDPEQWTREQVDSVVTHLCALSFVGGLTPWDCALRLFVMPMRALDQHAAEHNNRNGQPHAQRWRDHRNLIASRLAERAGSEG